VWNVFGKLIPLHWLILGAGIVLSTVLYRAYSMGSKACEADWLERELEITQALTEKHQRQLTLAVQEAERTASLRREINEISVPRGCVITAECMQPVNQAVRAINSTGADAASAPASGG
jgi:hypothetical protein